MRRLLQAAQGDRRDYAIVLLMASYGLGAAEIAALRLGDIDWSRAILWVQRPKTGAAVVLPLLPPVARALAEYLRVRPKRAATRAVFVSKHLPSPPISTSAIRHLVAGKGKNAGIVGRVGGHTLRHSFATRQIDVGANLKVVGDILGHRRPQSTSVYVRVALRRLREVALPVPR